MRMTAFVLALTLVAHCAHAGVPPQIRGDIPMSFRRLSEDTPQAAAIKERVREVRIRWTVPPTPAPAGDRTTAAQPMVVVKEQIIPGTIRRQRDPQVTTDQLVVVQRRADGAALDWTMIPNPRMIRAEVPGADGQLTGRNVQLNDVELMVLVSPLPAAVTLAVYQPRWTGTEHLLDLIAQVPLPRTR